MALRYKLIVSDYDGTLTHEDGFVPPQNAEAIARYRKAGGIFCVSTGRMHGSIVQELGKLGIDCTAVQSQLHPFLVVSYQGALITDVASGQRLHHVTMNRKVVRDALSYCKSRNWYCHFYSFDNFYTEKSSELSRAYATYTKAERLMVEAGDLVQYLDAHPALPVCKVLVIDEPARIASIRDELNAHFHGDAVFVQSAAYLTETVDAAAGKGHALRWLCDHYGIDVADTLAIGDSENDASMLAAAGLGVAMGNASNSLKQTADYVTEACDRGGFCAVIDKVLAGQLP